MAIKQLIYAKGKAYPLGAEKVAQGVNFSVELPDGADGCLCIVEIDSKKLVEKIFLKREYRYGNIGAVLVENLDREKYGYYYEIEDKPVIDPYARVLIGSRGFGKNPEREGYLCGFEKTYDWRGDQNPELRLEEIILYRTHVRGFTKHVSSTVEGKGTFYGLQQKIPYLKQIGINQIELMPVYDFQDSFYKEFSTCSSIEDYLPNYWGYSNYNCYYAVKEDYAYRNDAATELKELVRVLHENEMELVLEFYFPQNVTPIFIQECLRYWLLEYHVDGFHLTGEAVSMELLCSDPLFAKTKLYGASINDRNIYRNHQPPVFRNLAICSDDYMQHMRAFLKGDRGRSKGAAFYLNRNEDSGSYINYMSSHDGFTMCDMVSYNEKHNEANGQHNVDGCDWNYSWNCGVEGKTRKSKVLTLRKKQLKNAWMMLLCSQGIPAILGGDECCNTQEGNNNAYCQDNEIGWVNWKTPKYYDEIPDFVKKVISLRKQHPVLHSRRAIRFTDYEQNGFPDVSIHGEKAWQMDFKETNCHFGLLYCGAYVKSEPADYIYLAFNMNWTPQKFALPKLPKNMKWEMVLSTAEEIQPQLLEKDTLLKLEERSCAILVATKGISQKKVSEGKQTNGRYKKTKH